MALLVVSALGLAGCASRSPHAQDFVELRTDRFLLTSSLEPAETRAFARSLELFHGGVRALVGAGSGDRSLPPIPVFIFDDRSFGRPFAVANEGAYLIDAADAPILVLRGARDFSAAAMPELRQRLARRILRDHAPRERPLWYEEGVAWLASAMQEEARGVIVGRVIPEYRSAVLGWRREELAAALVRSDLSDASVPQRALFSAESWAIAHTLGLAARRSAEGDSLLDAYRRALDAAPGAQDRALAAIGLSSAVLVDRVHAHLEGRRIPIRTLSPRGFASGSMTPAPIARAESRTRLGTLALRIDRPALARDAFERALEQDAEAPAARIGLADAAARAGDIETADAELAAVVLSADAPVELRLAHADAWRALAAASPDEATRDRARKAAQAGYAALLEGGRPPVGAVLGRARLELDVPGGQPAEALARLDPARAVQRAADAGLSLGRGAARALSPQRTGNGASRSR